MQWYSIDIRENDAQKRFDSICKKLFPKNSYGDIMQWMRRKILKINHKTAKFNSSVALGDTIQIALPIVDCLSANAKRLAYPAESTSLFLEKAIITPSPDSMHSLDKRVNTKLYSYFNKSNILYSNNNIAVINKQAGEAIFGKSSIASKLVEYGNENTNSLSFNPAPCHRLDTGTSGILLCALSLLGARTVAKFQTNKQFRKIYLALLIKPAQHLTLTHILFRDKDIRKTYALLSQNNAPEDSTPLGESSVLLHSLSPIRLLSSYSYDGTETTLYPTLIILEGSGGKTHQIRAQCAASAYNLWGDIKYSSSRKKFIHIQENTLYTSFFLHAISILMCKDSDVSQSANSLVLPNSLYAPIPLSWYEATTEQSHEVLTCIDRFLKRFSTEWDTDNPSASSTEIMARCTSLFGGVMG